MIRKVHIRDLAGYIGNMPKERHQSAVRAARRTLRQRGRVIVREEIHTTQPRPPFDRGTYQNSWQVVDIPDGVRIFSTDPKASVIDRGRRPGFGVGRAGIQALIGWVQRHGMQRWDNNEGMRGRVTGKSAQLANARSIAFAIAAAIKRRGLPAKHVFERASKRIVEECRKAVRGAIAGAMEDAG